MQKCGWLVFIAFLSCLGLVVQGFTQSLPGSTVEERAVNGAREYIKKNNVKDPTLTMLMISLFKNSMPTYAKQWEELTGVKIKFVEHTYSDIPTKMMSEAVTKTAEYDIFNQFPSVVPDAAGASAIIPMDEYAAKGQPDFSSIEAPLRAQQYYNGKLYFFLLSSNHLMMVLRKDILELPGIKEAFQVKFGHEPGCPETLEQWEHMAEFFHTKKGDTRWGKTFDQGMFGAIAYRSINFLHQHFPVYFSSLLFDKDMKPRINTPHGVHAIQQFTSIVKYMPPDIQSWGTPQIYPFWASGQAFSVMSFPSIVAYANTNAESKIKEQQLSCLVPATEVNGKRVRRSSHATSVGYMVSRYSKHPELAYYFLQWFTGPTKGDEAIADSKDFWGPMRSSNLTHEGMLAKFGKHFLAVTIEGTKYATSLLMLPENNEYFNVMDKNLAHVMQGNMSPEEAARQIEAGWNKVTDDVGRQEQIKIWRSGVESGAYIDTF